MKTFTEGIREKEPVSYSGAWCDNESISIN